MGGTVRPCFLCGKEGVPYAKVEDHDYLKCPGCGLVYVDVIEPPDKLYGSYDGGGFKSLRRKLFMPFRSFQGAKNFERSMERARRVFDQVMRNSACPAGVFLDIGCNKGFLLAAAAEKGWDVHGVELVPELTIPFKKQYPQFADQVHSTGFGEAQTSFKAGMFDAISAIDVIEHFEDPRKDMSRIFEMLAPQGLLLVQTPDTQDPLAMERRENWGALKPREHLHLFSRHNLERFAKELGYREMKIVEAFDQEDGNFAAVLKK
ncbi:MAG TPA: class I SAM-dependent methyltransferase [bacterium]|nr:class I SAM-dependent methyltransferase [bacterium]